MLRIWKVILSFITLLFLIVLTWFVYTRFCLPKYEMQSDDIIIYKNNTYVLTNSISDEATEHLGKTIGIAVRGERSITDYIWPNWVIEYTNDKAHKRIFVRGLMDTGFVYEKK